MKRIALFFIALCSILTACMNPLPSDFRGKTTQGLSEDEVIVQWRLSKQVNERESLHVTHEDSLKAQLTAAPLFDQLIPKMFKDIEDKKLNIYEYMNIDQPSEKRIDVQARSEEMNGGKIKNPYLPLSYKLHFHITHPKQQKGLQAEIINLMILWTDVKELKPERIFGMVNMEDIRKLGYTIEMNSKNYPIDEYIKEFCSEQIFPVSFRTVEKEQYLRTLEEAFYLKDKILTGQWNSLSWMPGPRGGVNMSGKDPIDLPLEDLKKFVGVYAFPPIEASKDTSYLQIKEQEGHLVISWPIKDLNGEDTFFPVTYFPASSNELFDQSGDILTFKNFDSVTCEYEGTLRHGTRTEKYPFITVTEPW